MSVLAAEDVRYDSIRHIVESYVVDVEAAAESTRYHVIVVKVGHPRLDDPEWLVTIENLGVCLPLLPQLTGWHYDYLTRYCGNERTAMALKHILDRIDVEMNA